MVLIKSNLKIWEWMCLDNTFPSDQPDASLHKRIINNFGDATSPSIFQEGGCAMCGVLALKNELSDLSSLNIDLSLLNTAGLWFT